MHDLNRLNGPQRKILREALMSIFRRRQDLAIYLEERGSGELSHFVSERPSNYQVFELINQLAATGRLDAFIKDVGRDFPESSGWQDIQAKLLVAEDRVVENPKIKERGGLERYVRDSGFQDLNVWADKLTAFGRAVCRIQYTLRTHEKLEGMGFLIAPDLVLTTFHLIEPIVQGQADATTVRLSFGYAEGPMGIETGAQRRLSDDWLVAKSPYSQADRAINAGLPAESELDFAVLRLVPTDDTSVTPVPIASAVTPKAGEIVFILQHPAGDPVKLSNGVVLEEKSPLRLRYSADTIKGSSGALVLTQELVPAALHQSSYFPSTIEAGFEQGTLLSKIVPLVQVPLLSPEEPKLIDTGDHPLAGGIAPLWAGGWGEDEYGVFAEIEIEDVIQRLRWIPPGQFMMGSPETEDGRYKDEGPQTEITFARGFWLFDTAVTQALWTAVMGENPSGFPGDERPVETVSWDDAQRFIARLNERIPGLGLSLPSEAMWEYACRAGTETPYFFGTEARPDEIHFAQDQATGTAEVKAKPPNKWGLYQMHGNVLQWCEDVWSNNHSGAAPDGSPRQSSDPDGVRYRVIRGGSWGDTARLVRSASRYDSDPGHRFASLGVRCARGQVSSSGPEGRAAGTAAARAAEPRAKLWVLVAGTGVGDLPEEIAKTTAMVGTMLARQGFALITGGWRGVDEVAARAFVDALPASTDVKQSFVQVLPKGMRRVFTEGAQERIEPGEDEFVRSIERADLVVLIGGAGGTYQTYELAIRKGRPVFPMATTGSDAARAFQEMMKNWPEAAMRGVDQGQFKDVLSSAPTVAAQRLFELLEPVRDLKQ